ncbi:MAG: CBS domain-containing protein [Rhodospirillales bacterium]|nr:CBS domain-containing protein [Rhodospirillales bacterium]
MNDKTIIRVSDVMSTGFHAIDGLATVADAIRMMKQHSISSLAVNRRSKDDELGILAVADIATDVTARNRAPERVSVYEIMTKPAMTLPADMQTRYAARLLTRFHITRAIVVDRERNPLGMVTLRDLVLGHAKG